MLVDIVRFIFFLHVPVFLFIKTLMYHCVHDIPN
jgi:hypothetical protein